MGRNVEKSVSNFHGQIPIKTEKWKFDESAEATSLSFNICGDEKVITRYGKYPPDRYRVLKTSGSNRSKSSVKFLYQPKI